MDKFLEKKFKACLCFGGKPKRVEGRKIYQNMPPDIGSQYGSDTTSGHLFRASEGRCISKRYDRNSIISLLEHMENTEPKGSTSGVTTRSMSLEELEYALDDDSYGVVGSTDSPFGVKTKSIFEIGSSSGVNSGDPQILKPEVYPPLGSTDAILYGPVSSSKNKQFETVPADIPENGVFAANEGDENSEFNAHLQAVLEAACQLAMQRELHTEGNQDGVLTTTLNSKESSLRSQPLGLTRPQVCNQSELSIQGDVDWALKDPEFILSFVNYSRLRFSSLALADGWITVVEEWENMIINDLIEEIVDTFIYQ